MKQDAQKKKEKETVCSKKFLAYISENFWVELSGMSPEAPQISGDSILDLKCRHFGFNDDLGSLSHINRTVDCWWNVVIGKDLV